MPVPPTTVLDQGEIFWVDFPKQGAGHEQHGWRPCIVMSRLSVNGGGTVVIVPMTSRLQKASSFRILLPPGEIVKDVACSRPLNNVGSVALCDHMRVLDKTKLDERAGKLSASAVVAVQLGIAYFFDIR